MQIWENPIVNPAELARRSGMTRVRTNLLPNVPRPTLLTQQLEGCGCACQEGMGQYNPAVSLVRHDSMGDLLPPMVIHDSMGDLLPPSLSGLALVLPDGFDLGENVPSAGTGNTSLLNTIAAGGNFIPGIGQIASVVIQGVNSTISMFESWFGIGAGRREADLIVPTQNNLMTRLGGITDQIRTSSNPDLATLQSLYRQVWMSGVAFVEFVLMKTFTDRRASGQALNGVMPYIDGSCGYAVPVGPVAVATQQNCLTWGDNTVGGPGTNGMLGAIGRAIQAKGGTVQVLPSVTDAANNGYHLSETPPPGGTTLMGFSTPVAVGLGALAIYFFSRRTLRG